MLLLAVGVAAVFRFWQLGELPPGLYRDEAYNGLDALETLEGHIALFYPANNGREPFYIYLTALSVAAFGRSPLTVRLAAAVLGTATTGITYLLAAAWFGRRVGLLSAWLWAVTLWPVHLSRIGLRPITLVPFLAATFWLGTLAYRRHSYALWIVTGLVYGACFYCYLAIRFTPLLLLLLIAFLVISGRHKEVRFGLPWFGLGLIVALGPLISLAIQQPDLVLGRSGQVSILNPTINGGDLWGTLLSHLVKTLAMFFVQGDTILRHNPAGRPVFDLFMLLPFLVGLAWCLRHWRRPVPMTLLIWTTVMLGPTVLAEDAPHFLRAVGILPAALILPAIGLARLWEWQRLPLLLRRALVIALLLASSITTARDYLSYGRQSDVAYLFESAAADMAREISDEAAETAVFVDRRYWSSWPSIPFLVASSPVTLFDPETGIPGKSRPPAAIYAWPYGPLDFVNESLLPPVLVTVEDGGLARGDLDASASPLFVRYGAHPLPSNRPLTATVEDQLHFHGADLQMTDTETLQIDLYWSADSAIQPGLVVFVHVLGAGGEIVAQSDSALAGGRWLPGWWKPGVLLRDRHHIRLSAPEMLGQYRVQIGVYEAQSRERLQWLDTSGDPAGDHWLVQD